MVDSSNTGRTRNQADGPAFKAVSPEEPPASSVQPESQQSADEQSAAQEKEAWEKLFDLLFQPKLFGDFQLLTPAEKKGAQETVRSVLKDFPVLTEATALGKAIISGPLGKIEVQARLIAFDAPPQADGQRAVFTMEAARAMAQLASQNSVMVTKGIRLKGTKEEQELLSRAVEEINQKLEEGKRLRILPENAPSKDFNKEPQQTVPAKTASAQGVGKAETKPGAKPEPQPAEKNQDKPVDAVAEASSEQKQPEPQSATADKTEKQGLKERLRSFIGLIIRYSSGFGKKTNEHSEKSASSQKTILSRRAFLTGGSALAAATVVFSPTPSEAAEQKRRTLFDILFPKNKNHDRQKAGAGRRSERGEATGKRHSETKSQRQRRLKREAAEKAAQERAEKAQQAKERRKWNRDAKRVEGRTKKAREWIKPTPKPKKSFFGLFTRNEAGAPPSQKGTLRETFSAKSGGVYLYNRHTKERYYFDFSSIGTRTCTAKFNRFARDHYSGAVASMDPKLQRYVRDIVVDLRRKGHNVEQVDFISGYRTRATNKWLQKNRGGQASNSQHCLARALDLAVNGLSTKIVHNSACRVGCDGVGLYTKSGFVHVDSRGHTARW